MLLYLTFVTLLLKPYITLCFSADEITQLPGLSDKINFKQYSGYLNATKGHYLHYWFVESKSNPLKDPVILWLNGGPGCSSLGGFFTENGPFRVSNDSNKYIVKEEPNSWNTIANVIYLESPVGVGYSYVDSTVTTTQPDDESTAEDSYLALQSFFKKFPQFSNNSFYISGESYAGVYIPTLATKIFRNNSTIKLEGVAIGNGAFDLKILDTTKVQMYYNHGLLDQETWNSFMSHCCTCNKANGQVCNFWQQGSEHCDFRKYMTINFANNGISMYNLLDDCQRAVTHSDTNELMESRYHLDLNRYFGISFDEMKILDKFQSTKPQCLSNAFVTYLNTTDVRKAIHIHDNLPKWGECAEVNYNRTFPNMAPYVKELVEKHKIKRFIVYNGDLDVACDFIGDQQFVDSLGYKVIEKYKKWTVDGRTAGFLKRYEGITFTTVRGAGHMVPADQPKAALKIIEELIGKSKLDS